MTQKSDVNSSRALSKTESCLINLATQSGNWRVAHIVNVAGPSYITADMLRSPLDQLQKRHSILQHRIILGKPTLMKVDDAYRIPVVTLPRGTCDKEAWEHEGRKEFLSGDGVSKIVLVESETCNITTLIVYIEHAFCDGLSQGIFCHELLACVCSGASFEETIPVGPSATEMFGDTTKASSFKVFIKSIDCLLRMGDLKKCESLPIRDTSFTPLTMHKGNQAMQELCEIQSDSMASMIQNCRNNGTTVTGAVAASIADAFAATKRAIDPQIKHSICTTMLAADIRKYYKKPLNTNVLGFHVTSTLPAPIKSDGAGKLNDLWSHAKYFRGKIDESVNLKFPLWLEPLTRYMFRKPPGFKHSPTVFYTNWGVSPIKPSYGKDWQVCNVTPAITTTGLRTVVVITLYFDKRMCVATYAPVPTFSQDDLKRFSQVLGDDLKKMAKKEFKHYNEDPAKPEGKLSSIQM